MTRNPPEQTGTIKLPFDIACRPPFLTASFIEPQRALSWAITRPGFQSALCVSWLEVRNKDLPDGMNAMTIINQKLAEGGLDGTLALITSRDIRKYHVAEATVDDVTATCLATVGLSNGERIGTRSREPVPMAGTVNILVHVSTALTDAALLETMSVVTEARTAAIIDSGVKRDGVRITGTGTDCIVVASPLDGAPEAFAGLHTAIGEAVGRCTYEAIADGIETWRTDFKLLHPATTIS